MLAIEDAVLRFKGFLLRPASLPAVAPILNKEMETKCVDLESRLEADAEVAVGHPILGGIGCEEAEMAGDCKEQIVIPGGKRRELILQELRSFCGSCTLLSDSGLDFLG